MNEPKDQPPKQRYVWPWFLLAAVILGVAIAVVAMFFAAKRVEQQRDLTTPVQTR